MIDFNGKGCEHEEMYKWAQDLFPYCRSITGNGVRVTLKYLSKIMQGLNIREIETGTKCFDWEIPEEWNISEAYILDPDGTKIIDFYNNNLHVVSYSEPVDKIISLEELQNHLYSIEDQEDAIPYVTSYYKRRWGFCLTHKQRRELKSGDYRVVIKSDLSHGSMTFADLVLPGKSEEEILFSSYICHPSMANNELSGPILLAGIARWLAAQKERRYTYRFVLVPETIGAIAYLSLNLDKMKKNTKAGFVVTCVGDTRNYSFLPSRQGNTLSDKVARKILRDHVGGFREYSFLDRGSDERQYCFPGIDLPVASVMRSKYNTYNEYHTSLDDLNLISAEGFRGSFEIYKKIIIALEMNYKYKVTTIGEPRLGIRNLYPDLQRKEISDSVVSILNFLAYTDGSNDLIDIANLINEPFDLVSELAERFCNAKIVEKVN